VRPRKLLLQLPSVKSGRSKGLVTPQGFARAPASTPVPTHPLYSAHALNSQRMRETMVARLRAQGIAHPQVLAAMAQVPRHAFVDAALASRAYEDTALPIGSGQTISQPYVVARMLELALQAPAAAGGKPKKWLEIGTGCGYQAAVMAQLAGEVISIERIRALSALARHNLRALRIANLRLVFGDGLAGHADNAPFEAMVVAAAGLDLPPALLQQLATGGRAVAPLSIPDHVRSAPRVRTEQAATQWLTVIERVGAQQFTRTVYEPVNFVPLLAGTI
jgi:protein-L-isoaspartate(D-aspartate) O-methyltransferase